MIAHKKSLKREALKWRFIFQVNYAEVNLSEPGEGQFFKCKVAFDSVDENSGKVKRATNTVLIQAANIDDAFRTCKELFSTLIVDHKAISVTETSIVDVF